MTDNESLPRDPQLEHFEEYIILYPEIQDLERQISDAREVLCTLHSRGSDQKEIDNQNEKLQDLCRELRERSPFSSPMV
jgi:hypothetical protein